MAGKDRPSQTVLEDRSTVSSSAAGNCTAAGRRRGGGRRGADCHRRRRLEGFGEEEHVHVGNGKGG